MEKFVILAAAAAFVLACVAVATLSTRGQRPELRLPREEEFAGDDEERMIASLRPREPSPIDRQAPLLDLQPILDLEPIERAIERDREEGSGKGSVHGEERTRAR